MACDDTTHNIQDRSSSNVSAPNAGKAITSNESADLDKRLEYLLKIEEHADNFFEIKHKITLFLITASVGSMGYTLNFAVSRLDQVILRPQRSVCLVVGSLTALVTVALALLSMYYDMQSYRLNLIAYADRKLYDQLTPATQEKWGKTNRNATYCQRLAITFLFVSILYQTSLYVLLVFQ